VSKKLLMGLAPIVAVAALSVMPAVAQGAPRWFINGKLAEAKQEALVAQGAITLQNQLLGKINCLAIAPGTVWNASEKGLAATEALATYGCNAEPAPCPGVFVSDEKPVAVIERKVEGGEEPQAIREPGPLPWSEEAIEEEGSEKRRKLKIKQLLMTIVMPCLNLEVPFSGRLEPLLVNGVKNGLFPSHLQFQGQGGQTGLLTTTKLGSGEEASRAYVIGELATVGGNVELVTAE
jgi:hypothetical protein